MKKLNIKYAGLQLTSPVVVSSSSLTDSADKIKKLEEAGVGAVVLKSVFEEQIENEAGSMGDPSAFAEAGDYLRTYVRANTLDKHINLVKETKKQVSIPVIASINAYTDSEWEDFAVKLVDAGADAIEINILAVQADTDYEFGSFEQSHVQILESIKKVVNVPVIMKLGRNLTNPVALMHKLMASGAAAVVLFNRFYQTDIDIENKEFRSGQVFSHAGDMSESLRWTAVASQRINNLDIAISGGAASGEDVVKAILSGAKAVYVCSEIYRGGADVIGRMNEYLLTWLEKQGYASAESARGVVAEKVHGDINPFERAQFMKYFASEK